MNKGFRGFAELPVQVKGISFKPCAGRENANRGMDLRVSVSASHHCSTIPTSAGGSLVLAHRFGGSQCKIWQHRLFCHLGKPEDGSDGSCAEDHTVNQDAQSD